MGARNNKETIQKQIRSFHANAKERGYYWTQDQIERAGATRTGYKHTKEAIEKIRIASTGRSQSRESIEKTRLANIKKVIQIDKQTGCQIAVFNSITEANLSLKKSKSSGHIGQVCKGIRNSAFGYKWKFYENN